MPEPAIGLTLADMLSRWSRERPDALAFRQIDRHLRVVDEVPWGALAAQARAIAGALIAAGTGPGERILIATSDPLPTVRAVLGAFWAGAIAVPLPHGRGRRAADALVRAERICAPRAGLRHGATPTRGAGEVRWIDIKEALAATRGPDAPLCSATDVALVQFSSGTTGAPKGVRLTHHALVANQRAIASAFSHDDRTHILGWLPLNHDMGLVGNVLQTVHLGGVCTLLPARDFSADPLAWIQAVSMFRATTSGGPDGAYALVCDLAPALLDSPQAATLDLSCWTRAFSGAEPVRAQTLRRFAHLFSIYGFDPRAQLNSYGLAEASLLVTTGPSRDVSGNVPDESNCGQPGLGVTVRIVDPETGREQPEGQEGEVWVASESLAEGYWGDPETTARAFGVRLADDPDGPGYLRTGDLGRVRTGRLEVGGRLDDRITLFGEKLDAHEIEAVAAGAVAGLRAECVVAFTLDVAGLPGLALVLEPPADANPYDVSDAVAGAVRAAFDVPVIAIGSVRAGQLPRTTSGKPQRRACARLLRDGRLRRLDSQTPVQAEDTVESIALVSAALGRRVREHDLAYDLRALGGDSLAAARLSAFLASRAGLAVSPADLLAAGSLRTALDGARPSASLRERTAAASRRDLLGPLAKRLLAQSWLDEGTGASVVAWAARLEGAFSDADLIGAWAQLAATHAALRARHAAHGTIILAEKGDPLVVVNARGWSTARLDADMRRRRAAPHGARAALVRATIFRTGNSTATLLVTGHHAVCDLTSLRRVTDDLFAAQPPRRDAPGLSALATVTAYLTAATRGPAPIEIPADRPAPAAPDFCGAAVSRRLHPAALAAAVRLALQLRASLAEVLLAVWSLVLMRMGDTEEVEVVVPVDLRPAHGLEGAVGCGVATTVARARLDARTTLADLVAEGAETLRAALSGALRAQAEPAGGVAGPAARLDAAFLWHDAADAERLGLVPRRREARPFWTSRIIVEAQALPVDSVQQALVLNVALDMEGGALLRLDYAAARFEAATARSVLEAVATAVAALGDPNASAATLTLISPADAEFIARLERGPAPRAAASTLITQVREAARRAPDAIAVIDPQRLILNGTPLPERMDYATLELLSDGLAARLAASRVRRGDVVALVLPRSSLMIVAMLATLKTGAAFAPIAPTDPPARRAALRARLGATLTLCADAPARSATDGVLYLSAPAQALPFSVAHAAPGSAEDRAYVLFTSGSTGRPKAVAVSNRAIARRIETMKEELAVTAQDIVLHKTPTTFDVFLWEVFLPLAAGARVLVAEPGSERDPDHLEALIRDGGASIVHFVPSMLSAFLAGRAAACRGGRLRHVVSSGENLSRTLRDAALAAFGEGAALWNYYGPTEAAIDVARKRARAGEPRIPIGRPVAGATLVVRDRFGGRAPIGARGEILIGGDQLAEGYLGDQKLTRAAFVEIAGERFYRSGDTGRWTREGECEHLGRRDHQWKIRGQRIERGEIEAVLRALPGVGEAAATLVREPGGAARIEAHVTPIDPRAPPTPEAVRAGAAALLPAAMVPARVAVSDALPLTASGKLDRARLPPLPAPEASAAAPGSPHEVALCAAFAEALGRDAVGPGQSFFDLGGDSLTAIRAVASARTRGIAFGVHALYAAPTPRALAAALACAETTGAPAAVDDARADERGEPGEEDGAPFPLSSGQSGLLFLSESDPDYEIYVTSLRLRGPFDGPTLLRAVQASVDRHAFLRIVYDTAAGPEPLQRVLPRAEATLAVHDIRSLDTNAQAAAIAAFVETERRWPFDWGYAPMLRVAAHRLDDETFQLTFADPSLDGWCVATVLTEIVETYGKILTGRPIVDATPAPALYRAFVALERRAAADPEAIAFWRATLAQATAPSLALAAAREGARRMPRRRTASVAEEDLVRLVAVARRAGTPLRSILLAAHVAATWRLRGARGGLVAIETTGRPEVRGGDVALGVYNNIVTLSVPAAVGSWLDLARTTHEAERAAMPYRRVPHAVLRRLAGGSVADAVFVQTDFRPYRRLAEGPVQLLDIVATDQTYAPLTAHVTRDPLAVGLRLVLDHDAARIDAAAADGFLEAWHAAIAAIARRPYDAVDVGRARPPARKRMAEPISIIAAIAAQARRLPDAIAVSQGAGQLTYAALERKSGSVAAALRARGIGPEHVVALDLSAGTDLVVGMLGVLKAGAAFLPLDTNAAPARRADILEAARPALVLSAGGAGASEPAQIELREACAAPPETGRSEWPDTLAYVLFTSGSTGRPKGVAVGRHALSAYVDWAAGTYAFDSGRGAGLVTAADVDMSLTSLLCPLVRGRRLAIAATPGDLADLAAFAADPDLGVLKITPSHLDALAAADALPHPERWPAQLVVGGEDLVARHASILAVARTAVVNEYGPTEGTVGCAAARLSRDDLRAGAVHLGTATSGSRIALVDAIGQDPPDGLPGEIVIGGAQLARCYLGDRARTATAFRPDPAGCTRVYLSGDQARRLPGGRLVFLGRGDQQAKIRGRRVELGEIEAACLRTKDVAAAACAAVEGLDGRKILGACLAPRRGARLDPVRLRAALVEALGEAIAPSRVVVVDAIPLTPSGKTDRRAVAARLAAPEAHPDGVAALLRRIEAMSDEEAAALLAARLPLAREEVKP